MNCKKETDKCHERLKLHDVIEICKILSFVLLTKKKKNYYKNKKNNMNAVFDHVTEETKLPN